MKDVGWQEWPTTSARIAKLLRAPSHQCRTVEENKKCKHTKWSKGILYQIFHKAWFFNLFQWNLTVEIYLKGIFLMLICVSLMQFVILWERNMLSLEQSNCSQPVFSLVFAAFFRIKTVNVCRLPITLFVLAASDDLQKRIFVLFIRPLGVISLHCSSNSSAITHKVKKYSAEQKPRTDRSRILKAIKKRPCSSHKVLKPFRLWEMSGDAESSLCSKQGPGRFEHLRSWGFQVWLFYDD